MKRILSPIVVTGILLLSACGAPATPPGTETPPTKLEPTREPEPHPRLNQRRRGKFLSIT